MNNALLEKILKKAHEEWDGTGNLVTFQMGKVGAIRNIQERMHNIVRKNHDAHEQYRTIVTELDKERKQVQAECDHPVTTYHPDAAGGSDSWRQCDICGAEV